MNQTRTRVYAGIVMLLLMLMTPAAALAQNTVNISFFNYSSESMLVEIKFEDVSGNFMLPAQSQVTLDDIPSGQYKIQINAPNGRVAYDLNVITDIAFDILPASSNTEFNALVSLRQVGDVPASATADDPAANAAAAPASAPAAAPAAPETAAPAAAPAAPTAPAKPSTGVLIENYASQDMLVHFVCTCSGNGFRVYVPANTTVHVEDAPQQAYLVEINGPNGQLFGLQDFSELNSVVIFDVQTPPWQQEYAFAALAN